MVHPSVCKTGVVLFVDVSVVLNGSNVKVPVVCKGKL